MPNLYLGFLIVSIFCGVNKLFVLLFENKDDGEVHTNYFFQL